MFDKDEENTEKSDYNTFSRGETLLLEYELYEEDSIEV
jgi:hypothetical protein